MNIEDVRRVVNSEPFGPFEMRFSNGRVYTVDHPDSIALSRDGRAVAFYTHDSRLITTAVQQISTIERLNRPSAA